MLQISAQTWNFFGPGNSVLGGSDVIAAETEEVVDVIVGLRGSAAPGRQI
jgi:hypothetical protein